MSNFYPPSTYKPDSINLDEVNMQNTECMTCGETLYYCSENRKKFIDKEDEEQTKASYVRFTFFEGNPTIDGHKAFCSSRCLDAHRVARHVANGSRRFKVTWKLCNQTEVTTHVWVNPKLWSDDEHWNEFGDSKEEAIQNTAANFLGQTHDGISDDYLRYFDTVSDRDYRFRKVFECVIEEVRFI